MSDRHFSANAVMQDQYPAVGGQCPVFDVKDVHGVPIVVGRTLVAGRSTLLMFMNMDNPANARLLAAMQGVAAYEGADVLLLSRSTGSDAGRAAKTGSVGLMTEHQRTAMRHVVSDAISERFGVGNHPFGVLLDAQGVIVAMGQCTARRHIEKLFGAQRRGYYSLSGYLSRISRYAKPVYGLR